MPEIKGAFLVDTNVLLYATLANDPRHLAAQAVIQSRLLPGNRMSISTQNLAEMYPNLTGPKTQPADSPEVARQKIAAYARLDAVTVHAVTRSVVERALLLCEEYRVTGQRYFDLQLMALMLEEGIFTIVTENEKDFREIRGIQVVNPF